MIISFGRLTFFFLLQLNAKRYGKPTYLRQYENHGNIYDVLHGLQILFGHARRRVNLVDIVDETRIEIDVIVTLGATGTAVLLF